MFQILNSLALKILPVWLHDKLIGSWDPQGFKKYFENTGWMFAARVITFITSFLTVAIVARYLGPENLGRLSYAQSFVSIISVFASFGIDQILYRDLSAQPERENEFLGTAVISKLFFGTFAFLLSVILSVVIGNDVILTTLIAITAFTFFINPLGTISVLFQSKVQAKYLSQISIFLAFFIPALKFLVIFLNKGIVYFSLLLIVESLAGMIWYLYIYKYKYKSSIYDWKFSFSILKRLLRDSWPFLFASLFGYLYARIDKIMLQHYIDSASVGFYDVAVKLTTMWNFIPGLIIGSLFPAIVRARNTNHKSYLKRLKSLFILISFISLTVTIFIFLYSKILVLLVFGEQYTASVDVLRIYLWSSPLAITGVLIQQYLTTENKGLIHLTLALGGVITNICLNLYMIPHYGMAGAAISTLFSYAIIPIGLLFFRAPRLDILSMLKFTR